MANYEETRYDFDGANLTDIEGVNTGIIVPWSDSTLPNGFLNCDGAAVSRTTYATLFGVIGTNYGAGDGSTTFNVPDLTDRTAVGKSPTKSQFGTGGANTVASSGNVAGSAGNTTISVPTLASHNHPGTSQNRPTPAGNTPGTNRISGNVRTAADTTSNSGGGGAHSHPLAANFAGDATSVLQPYLTLKYIIKT